MEGKSAPKAVEPEAGSGMRIREAIDAFLGHVQVHSPDKPQTVARYRAVMDHFERLLGWRLFVESINRSDIDRYRATRSREKPRQRHGERVTPGTVNSEVSVLRTFFNFLIHERQVDMENPCARFKPLRDASGKSNGRAPTYSQEEVARILDSCDGQDRVAFATLLLTGMREQELCYQTWDEVKPSISGYSGTRALSSSATCASRRSREAAAERYFRTTSQTLIRFALPPGPDTSSETLYGPVLA